MSTENQALEVLKHFEELMRQFAPDVIDIAANVVFVSAINKIVFGGLVAILLAMVAFKVAMYLQETWGRIYKNDIDLMEIANMWTWVGAIIFIVMFTILSLCNLLNLWNWVALFKPHLALAQKVLGM